MTGSSGNSEFSFPLALNVPLDFASGNIEGLGEIKVTVSLGSGGSRGGARAPHLFWVKKEVMTEGKMAERASKSKGRREPLLHIPPHVTPRHNATELSTKIALHWSPGGGHLTYVWV